MSTLARVSKTKYNKLAKRDTLPDMNELGKADNLLRQMRHGHGYDPLTELIELSRHKETSVTERIRIASELLAYTAPKMKAMPVKQDMGEVININIAYPNADLPQEKVIDIEKVEEE